MQPLRESLNRLLEAYEPNPALIVDGLPALAGERPDRFDVIPDGDQHQGGSSA